MSFNAVDAYWDSFKAFKNDRGGLPSSGLKGRGVHPFFKPIVENYPATTWGDVFLFSQQFIRKTDPDSCFPGGLQLAPDPECIKARDFVHTDDFERAKADWKRWMPQNRVGMNALAAKVASGEIYPYNEAFWGYGKDYARARNAAGIVEGRWSMAKRSLAEAVEEFPETVQNAANKAGDLIPSVTPWVNLLKWGTVAGGLFMLYWYVLKPKPKQSQTQ